MNRFVRRWVWVVAAAVAVAASLVPNAAAAEAAPTKLEVRLQTPRQPKLPHLIVAHLSTSNGSAVTGVNVSVYLDVSLFGGTSALLGTGVTDTSGDARVAIIPDRATYEVRARFAGTETAAPSEVVTTITVPSAEVKLAHEPGGTSLLAGVREAAPRLVAVLVGVLWLLLIAGSIWVLRKIHRHGTAAAFEGADGDGR